MSKGRRKPYLDGFKKKKEKKKWRINFQPTHKGGKDDGEKSYPRKNEG